MEEIFKMRGAMSDEADIHVYLHSSTGEVSVELSDGDSDENSRHIYLDTSVAWHLASSVIERILSQEER